MRMATSICAERCSLVAMKPNHERVVTSAEAREFRAPRRNYKQISDKTQVLQVDMSKVKAEKEGLDIVIDILYQLFARSI